MANNVLKANLISVSRNPNYKLKRFGMRKIAGLLAMAAFVFTSSVQAEQSKLPTLKKTQLKAMSRIPASSTHGNLATFNWSGGCNDLRVQASTVAAQSFDHMWDLRPVPKNKIKAAYGAFQDDMAIYYVISHEKERQSCASKYLSGALDCGGSAFSRRVQLWHKGDEDGAQWWNIVNNGDGSLTFENVHNKFRCGGSALYLSTDETSATRYSDNSYTGLNFKWIVDDPAGGKMGVADGRWDQLIKCEGCGPLVYKYTLGVSKGEDKSWVTTQKAWVEATISTSLKITAGPVEGETIASATGGSSSTRERAIAESFSITQGTEKTITCPKQNLFQWTTSIQQFSVGGLLASVAKGNIFLCTDNNYPEPLAVPI